MIKIFLDFFKSSKIRNKIFFTLFILLIFRIGSAIPAPYVKDTYIQLSSNSLLSMMSLLGGGSIDQMSIFSLGVGPYITGSIIIQLLSMDVIPPLTELAKSGKKGQQQMDKIMRYLGVVLAMTQGYFLAQYMSDSYGIIKNPGFSTYLYIALIFTAGTMFTLWLADQITTKGIGNGVSVIIFAGIVANLPTNFQTVYATFVGTASEASAFDWAKFGVYILMYVVILVCVVLMQLAERRIPIQNSGSQALNRTKGDLNHLPLKVNSASVIPVIFTGALIQGPQIIASWVNTDAYSFLSKLCDFENPYFLLFYAALIIAFTFFYTNLTVDAKQMAENLNKEGSYIPGVRPGAETKEYVSKVLNRITVLGAILLALIAVLPYIIVKFTNLNQSAALGGTGIIIVVGVAMDTIKGLKGQLTSKQYKGFIGK